MSTQSKRKNQPESIDNHEGHLPDYETMRKRCAYCALGGGKENRTFAVCLSSNIPLCLVKERIYFPICLVKERICLQKHHIQEYIQYMLYIFLLNLCGFFCLVFIYLSSLFEFFVYIIFYIYIVIFSILRFERPKICQREVIFYWEVIRTIPSNQLMLWLICHFSQTIRNESEEITFSNQRETSVPRVSG